MSRIIFLVLLCAPNPYIYAQQPLAPLTVEKIMRDPKWIGASPSNPRWSDDGKKLYFDWNPDQSPADSVYYIALSNKTPIKASVAEKQQISTGTYRYNQGRTAYTYEKDGDIYYNDGKKGVDKRITQTAARESSPYFSFNDSKIIYTLDQNLYAWDIATGEILQVLNISSASNATPPQSGMQRREQSAQNSSAADSSNSQQEEWLKNDQLKWFDVLRSRKEKRDLTNAYTKSLPKDKEFRSIKTQGKLLTNQSLSPTGRFVTYNLIKQTTDGKSTIVPNYVTESGFTTDIPARTKVGTPQSGTELYIYDRDRDTIILVKTDSLQGIKDLPDYVKDYPVQLKQRSKNPVNRPVYFIGPSWSPNGEYAVVDVRSRDNKDRWLALCNTETGGLKTLDRQRDEAWIGGPGIGFNRIGWINDHTIWYQSEKTGYSHLYILDVTNGKKTALTSGNYEVQQAQLSLDKKYLYIITNEVHPGEQQFYKLRIADGKKEQITTMTGANQVAISPDEKYLAILYSYSTKPWELFLMENKPAGKIEQITTKAQSDEFKSYPWKDPEVITFKAADGADVYARVYKPANPNPNKPAVLFVHGAGYLQNAHKWWSSYFREYMFNNMLADNGYYVMDIDYRGSAGYGRDWRTGIYRHMGGKDLSDQVDAVNYLVKTYGVNPKHVGLYGGSYGGFITLMGMFTEPNVFAAGAALRPVTDWAQYNHGYTSNILNEPFTDSIAYRRSSPLYFADGLKGHLLICHGMVDVNVHFQDAVKLSQRLIELGKDNWELAPYPMEDHGFVEPSSWTDEYKRIYKLFETVLKK